MTKIFDQLKPYIRPLYFLSRLWINRIPLLFFRGIQSLPLGLNVYDRESLSPPDQSCRSEDWFAKLGDTTDEKAPKYILVDDACEFSRTNQPMTGDPIPHPQFIKEKVATPFPASISVLPQGRVWGEYGAIITADNTLLEDLSVYRKKKRWGEHRIFSDWHLCSLTKLDGVAAVLATDSAGIYYHWVMDLLLRYALLLRAGFTLESFDKIIIGSCSKPFQAETLELLGLKTDHGNKLIQTSDHVHIQVDTLVVPSYPAAAAQYRPWQIKFLRDSFLPQSSSDMTQKGEKKRIYISRGDATYRRVLNEADVIELLEEYGFEVVQLADFSFAEQAALMASAEVVVAPHGSGLTNLIFCSPGTKIVEIFSPEMVALYFWKLSDLCQLDYYYTVGNRAKGEAFDQTWNRVADISVSIDQLRETLRVAKLNQ